MTRVHCINVGRSQARAIVAYPWRNDEGRCRVASTILVVPAQAVQHEVLVLQYRRFGCLVAAAAGSGGYGRTQQVTLRSVLMAKIMLVIIWLVHK